MSHQNKIIYPLTPVPDFSFPRKRANIDKLVAFFDEIFESSVGVQGEEYALFQLAGRTIFSLYILLLHPHHHRVC